MQNSKQADGKDKVQPKVETKQNKKVVQKVSESEDEEDEEYKDLDMEDDEQENDEESEEEEEDELEESVEDKKVIPNNKNQHANANIDKNNKSNKNSQTKVILNTQQKPKVIQTQKDNLDVDRKNSYENLAAKPPHKPEEVMKNVNKNQAQNKTPKEGDKPKKNSFDNSNNKLQEIKELVHQERKLSQEENAKAQNKNDSKGTTNKVQVKSKI